MQDQILERRYFRLLPAAQTSVVVDLEHVIGKVFAETEFVGFRFLLQLMRCGQSNGHVLVLVKGARETGVICDLFRRRVQGV